MAEVITNIFPSSSNKTTLQSFIFTDYDELHVINQNMSYQEICDESGNFNTSYLIHDYESLEQPHGNIFPLHSIQCIMNSPIIDPPSQIQNSQLLVITASTNNAINNKLILNQLYINIFHKYCPTECHDCDLPLWDQNTDPRMSLFLQDWLINKPITAGWNITTSQYSYQQIIKSVRIYIYGLTKHHQIQITIYDYASDKYVSQSIKHVGNPDKNKYDIELPIKTNDEYNYLLPNHQYAINIRLYNITSNDAKSIQIVLQNITDMYYTPSSYNYFTNINGLLFIYSEYFNFDLAHNAVSLFTPFGSICMICIGKDDDTLPLPPTTAVPSDAPTTANPTTTTPTITPSTSPTTTSIEPTTTAEPTPFPVVTPTDYPTDDPTTAPTIEPTIKPTIFQP